MVVKQMVLVSLAAHHKMQKMKNPKAPKEVAADEKQTLAKIALIFHLPLSVFSHFSLAIDALSRCENTKNGIAHNFIAFICTGQGGAGRG